MDNFVMIVGTGSYKIEGYKRSVSDNRGPPPLDGEKPLWVVDSVEKAVAKCHQEEDILRYGYQIMPSAFVAERGKLIDDDEAGYYR